MAQYVALRALNRGTKIKLIDALSGQQVQLSTTADLIVDMDNVTNRINLSHHSAINQWYITGLNNTVTAISGTVTISGTLTTLPPNVVQVVNTP